MNWSFDVFSVLFITGQNTLYRDELGYTVFNEYRVAAII